MQTVETRGHIGPNAVIQLGAALEARARPDLAAAVYARAGHPEWLGEPPTEMVSERDVARLHAALRDLAAPEDARALARDAGARTARYLLANRIPRLAQRALRLLPVPLRGRALLGAIAKHAWTFAGTGGFAYEVGSAQTLVAIITANPLARDVVADAPACVWHEAVLETLFRELVSPCARVRERTCVATGHDACRFEIGLGQGPDCA